MVPSIANAKVNITLPAIRKDFWECLISRHPTEEDHAPSTRNAYRWRIIPGLHLVVGQYVNLHGVGVYMRGEKGVNPDEVEQRLRPYAAKLQKTLGVHAFFSGHGGAAPTKYFFLKFKGFNTSKTNNWSKMADWLNKQADFYETTLRQVMGGRRT
jgi:hypothetical protein